MLAPRKLEISQWGDHALKLRAEWHDDCAGQVMDLPDTRMYALWPSSWQQVAAL